MWPNTQRLTPLMLAARNNSEDICLTLLQFKADPNLLDDRTSATSFACANDNDALLRIFLSAGAKVGRSEVLHTAAQVGAVKCLKVLLQTGDFE